MNFPYFSSTNKSKDYQTAFYGYNRTENCRDGEFYDMKNMSSDLYPVLSQREKRGIYSYPREMDKFIAGSDFSLAWVEKEGFYTVERTVETDEDFQIYFVGGEKWIVGLEELGMTSTEIMEIVRAIKKGDILYNKFIEESDGFVFCDLYTTRTYQATALISKDALCYLSGNDFYVNNKKIDGFVVPNVEEGKKQQLISMGAYVVFYPQGKWYNTANGESGAIEAYFPAEEENPQFTFTLAKSDGSAYESLGVEGDPTKKPETGTEGDGSYYIDTTVVPNVVKQYSDTTKAWVSVPTTYVKIKAENIDKCFDVGDGITISGIPTNPSDSTEADRNFEKLNGANVIVSKGDGYIVVTGLILKVQILTGVKVERKMPDMDFIVESQNRLWGCKYGENKDGKVVNEIYASKLGDFKNWNCFEGIASDSYVASVGSDGKFTGAITYQGNPIFFKEDCIHKVFGSIPANYHIQTTACNGVQYGSEKSLAIANNILFYKGIGGIYAYDGSLPVLASASFGNEEYDSAVAGEFAGKYYVSLRNVKTGKYEFFVYDTQKSLWHKEDALHATEFCKDGTNLYYLSADDDKIHKIFGGDESDEGDLEWYVETGVLGKDSPQKKYCTKLNARMQLAPMARVSFYAEYDSTGGWQHLCTVEGRTMQSFNIPIRLRRCDHLRLRIQGKGVVHLHSLSKTMKEGSDT